MFIIFKLTNETGVRNLPNLDSIISFAWLSYVDCTNAFAKAQIYVEHLGNDSEHHHIIMYYLHYENRSVVNIQLPPKSFILKVWKSGANSRHPLILRRAQCTRVCRKFWVCLSCRFIFIFLCQLCAFSTSAVPWRGVRGRLALDDVNFTISCTIAM